MNDDNDGTTLHESGGVVQPTDAQINGEAPNARNLLAALIDIYDDTQDCPPEHRCYVPEAWGDTLRMARQFLAVPQAPLQAEPVPVVASEPMFWVRLCGDGLYEGPHHHKSAEGKMLRDEKPGQWHPLFLATPQAEPAVAEPAVAEQAREASSVLEAFLTHWVEDVEPKWKTLAKDMARHDISTNRLTKELESSWRAWQAALASQSTPPPAADALIEALKFYAEKQHFDLADPDAWDTVSGEPQNWWCDEAGTATVEDGSVAAAALAGKPLRLTEGDAAPAAPSQSTPPPESAGQGLSDAQICEVEHAVEALRQIAGGQTVIGDTVERVADIRRARGIATIAHRRLEAVLAILAANPTAQPDGGSKA